MSIIDSFRYRVLKPILINPPYSDLKRSFFKNLLSGFKIIKREDLSPLKKDIISNLDNHGCATTHIDLLNNIDSAAFNNFQSIINLSLKLGFSINGKIENMSDNLRKVIIDKINFDSKKKYKINVTELFNREMLRNYCNSHFFINVVNNYLQVPTKLSYCEIIFDHNIHNQQQEMETQMFHRDHNGVLFLKIFTYLTDVKIENGPYSYIEKSHKSENLKLKKSNIKNNIRYDNSDIYSKLKKSEKVFIGKPGSIVFTDTTGLHRGYLPDEKFSRLLISTTYEPVNSFFSFSE
jgi:hypothetical protein